MLETYEGMKDMEGKDFGKLIRGITLNVNCFIGSNIEQYGIKQGQFEYFLLIFSIPGINQLEIGRLKNVGKASVTKALKILEEDGFIRRETDEIDRRNTLCYITPKGEAIVEDLLNVKTKAESRLFDGFSEDDKKHLFEYLVKLHKNSELLATDFEK